MDIRRGEATKVLDASGQAGEGDLKMTIFSGRPLWMTPNYIVCGWFKTENTELIFYTSMIWYICPSQWNKKLTFYWELPLLCCDLTVICLHLKVLIYIWGPRWGVQIPYPVRNLRQIPYPAEIFELIPYPVAWALIPCEFTSVYSPDRVCRG